MQTKRTNFVQIIAGIPIAFTIFTFPQPGNTQIAAEFKIHCMSRIMYSSNRRRSEITESAAATACQNASTAEQSLAVANCVIDTLYNSSGSVRNGMNANVAASVCQRATTIASSEQISKCMKNFMYDARGRLRPGASIDLAVDRCRRF